MSTIEEYENIKSSTKRSPAVPFNNVDERNRNRNLETGKSKTDDLIMNVTTPHDSSSALQSTNDDCTSNNAPSLAHVRGKDDTTTVAPNMANAVVPVATRPQNTKAIPTNVNINNNNNNNNNNNKNNNNNSNSKNVVVAVSRSATAPPTHQSGSVLNNPVVSYKSVADWQLPPPFKILPQQQQHVISTTTIAETTTTNAAHAHDAVMNRVPPAATAAAATGATGTARTNVPRPPPVVTTSFAVGQHHAAAAAAAQHLQWNHHHNKKPSQRLEGPRLAKPSPEVIEIEDDTDNQNQELMKHFTAAIQRQIDSKEEASGRNKGYPESRTNSSSGTDRQPSSSSISDTGRQNQTFQNSNNSTNRKHSVMNERKRSATEPVHQEPPKRHAAATQQRHSLPTSNATKKSKQYGHHGPQVAPNHSSNIPQVNVNDAMNMALDAAILSDMVVGHGATKAMSSNGRRVDTPMTYLVRQLLGQVEILGDEPAVVLAPPLVRDASNKIRLVISKLIDMVVVKSKKDSEFKLHEAEVRQKGFDEATQQRNYQALKHFSDEKCQQLSERDKLIDFLRTKLHAQEAEMENAALRQGGGGTKATNSSSEKSNATMRNLISRLDDGLTTIQRQQKEIQVLRGIIDRDTNSLLKRRDMIPYIKELFGLIDATDVPNPYIVKNNEEFAARIPASDSDMNHSVRAEIEELQATLQSERQEHERILKAYMKAAVHALKMQSGDA